MSQLVGNNSKDEIIVQYVLVRRDLQTSLNWPLARSACVAAVAENLGDQITQEYIKPENIDHMAKVCLEAKNEEDLRKMQELLVQRNMKFKLWIEQPENIATALAAKPYKRKDIAPLFKGFKLLK